MTASLAIADHGLKVALIEKSSILGGVAHRVHRTIEGASAAEMLEKSISRVESHPNISVYKNAEIVHSRRRGGNFLTTVEIEGERVEVMEHGVAILATGGREAPAQTYCHGMSESIFTQLELEERIRSGTLDPAALRTVAMVQCVGSREKGRNYCSRVCCASALKNALYLKECNPDLDIYIFYRDIMTYGFLETHFTRARRDGIIFIQYTPEKKPEVCVEDGKGIRIAAHDPILGRDIVLKPDILVLSTGIIPNDQHVLAGLYGVEVNEDGFLMEADYKWQPVESPKRGVFLCGLAHSPRSIPESIAMAQAAAQRALAMLNRDEVHVGSIVAEVRHSLCSLCERCVSACPYGARQKNEDEEIIEVDELACRGCGSCAAVCPNSASVVRGYSDRQVMGMLDAALE
jgi:heterodisulfide reductase subunit A